MKSKRTLALSISPNARKRVQERDKWCVLCGSHHWLEIAHYVSRGRGGVGIEENLVLLCHECHMKYDQSKHRTEIKETLKNYLQAQYPNWDERKLFYKKGNL